MFWGAPTQVGSLCHLREVIKRNQVVKSSMLVTSSWSTSSKPTSHQGFSRYLVHRASQTTYHTSHLRSGYTRKQRRLCIIRSSSGDYTGSFSHQFLHAYLYIDLREAIRWENGPVIVRFFLLQGARTMHVKLSTILSTSLLSIQST